MDVRTQAERWARRRFAAAKRRLGSSPDQFCLAFLPPAKRLDADALRALVTFVGEDAVITARRGVFVHPEEARRAPSYLVGLWPFSLPRNAFTRNPFTRCSCWRCAGESYHQRRARDERAWRRDADEEEMRLAGIEPAALRSGGARSIH